MEDTVEGLVVMRFIYLILALQKEPLFVEL
jgi:hypothetical protein